MTIPNGPTLQEKVNFIIKIGSAFHNYGTNAPRLEAALTKIAHHLDLNGNFFSTPTYLSISIDDGEEQTSRNARVNPGDVNLEKLSDIDDIAVKVCENKLSISAAREQINTVNSRPLAFSNSLIIFAFALTSSSLAVIFNGSYKESLISFLIGATVGVLAIVARKSDKISDSFHFIAAFSCTLLAYFFKIIHPQIEFQILVMSSLIAIIPGLSLTIAITELASKNLVSGTARIMGAGIDFFKISFGVLMGAQAGVYLFGEYSLYTATPLPDLYIVPATIMASASFTVIFNAKLIDFRWILVSGILALGTLKLGSLFLSPVISLFIAGLFVGSASNIFARLRNQPAMIPLLPGIIFLVPGSIGFKGLNLLIQSHSVEGIAVATQSLLMAITLVAGLFAANIVVNPRRSL